MPLTKSTLAESLAAVFEDKPSSSPEAGLRWAQAYLSYASPAQSSLGSLPVTAPAGLAILVGAFTTGLTVEEPEGSAAAMTAGVMAFWQSMVWAGPAASGSTAAPGNFDLAPALMQIFADSGGGGTREKADKLADAFDSGAKMVVVVDVPFAPPNTPVAAPIQ